MPSKIVSYAQGYALMRDGGTARTDGTLNDGGIALMWRGGCIIRSGLPWSKSRKPMTENPQSGKPAAFDPISCGRCNLVAACLAWRVMAATAMLCGVPVPAMSGGAELF